MHILFDARHLSLPYTGIGRYVVNLLRALLTSEYSGALTILVNRRSDLTLLNDLVTSRSARVSTEIIETRFKLKKFAHHLGVSWLVNKSRCSVYFYPHFDVPFFVNKKTVAALHDLTPLLISNYFVRWGFLKRLYIRFTLRHLLKRQTVLLAISSSSRDDMIRVFNLENSGSAKLIHFCHCATSLQPVTRKEWPRKKPFLLYVGERRPHKNLGLMLRTFNSLRQRGLYDGEFVLIGSKVEYEVETSRLIRSIPGVVELGFVSDEVLAQHLDSCDALLFITKYEGFGLPIVEAAQFGRKIITSDIGATGEIAPPWSLLVSPEAEPDCLAAEIGSYLNRADPIQQEVESYGRQFSWARLAGKLVELASETSVTTKPIDTLFENQTGGYDNGSRKSGNS